MVAQQFVSCAWLGSSAASPQHHRYPGARCARPQPLLAIAVLAVLSLALPLSAQPKPGYAPSSTHIFPAGGQRGTSIEVRVGTECVPPGSRFTIVGEDVTVPKILGDEISDVGEPSPRRPPTEIPITYPREWQSRIEIGAEVPLGPTFWRVSCAQGGTASRPFIVGVLPEYIESESNSTLARAEPVSLPITLNGQINGERDVDYYRFKVTSGQLIQCDVMARRLGSRLDPIVEILDASGQSVGANLSHIGSDPQLMFQCRTDGEYMLRLANVTFHGSPAHVYRINLTVAAERIDRIDDTEHEPNNAAGSAFELGETSEVDGRFATATDEDWFRFSAENGEWFTITCSAWPRGTSALPTLMLTDTNGKQLTTVSCIESSDGVCRIEWKAPADGQYYLRTRDVRFGARGSDELRYRLAVHQSSPDFDISLNSDCVNVEQGGKAEIEVTARRFGGFDGEIELAVDGLPEGVKCEGAKIAKGAKSAKLQIAASDDVRVEDARLRIIGRADIGKERIERFALATHLGADDEGISVGPRSVELLHLTVCHKPVFRLHCSEHYQYAHRGTVYPYLMEIERLNGFDGAITLQIGDRQNRDLDGIQMHEVVIPADKTSGLLPIYLPETMHINIQSQSQLYSQGFATFEDKHNRRQSVLVLSEKRNMLRTLPPVVKLEAIDKEIRTSPGKEFVCHLRLQRTSNFAGPMTLELLASEPKSAIRAEPIVIGEREQLTQVKVRVRENVECGTRTTIRFRATGRLNNGTIVISEAAIPVLVQ